MVTYNSFDDGNGKLERHSAEYWVLSTTHGFTLTFGGNSATAYSVKSGVRHGDHVTLTEVALSGQVGSFTVYDPASFDEVVVIVANVGAADEEEGYTLRLESTGQTPPTATFTVEPISGTMTTEFTFDASGSTDGQTPSEELEVRWDWEGDAVWDTVWSVTKTTTHTFGRPGTFSTTLQVRDELNLRDTAVTPVPVTARGVFMPVIARS
jgi:hypothetical protein